MLIYPAIDMQGGRCVRLLKGRAEDVTDYGDPVVAAMRWQAEGAQWLHVVDLDGAFTGGARNLDSAQRIAETVGLPVQLGGGIRTMDDIRDRLEKRGIARVILGTVAIEQPELVRDACAAYPGRIACGIDAMGGQVAVRGWVQGSGVSAVDLALAMREMGVVDVIYTDIARDGTLTGPNVAETAALIRATGLNVIGSGGVGSLADIAALKQAGCAGVICGKALYNGNFTLGEAIATAGK